MWNTTKDAKMAAIWNCGVVANGPLGHRFFIVFRNKMMKILNGVNMGSGCTM